MRRTKLNPDRTCQFCGKTKPPKDFLKGKCTCKECKEIERYVLGRSLGTGAKLKTEEHVSNRRDIAVLIAKHGVDPLDAMSTIGIRKKLTEEYLAELVSGWLRKRLNDELGERYWKLSKRYKPKPKKRIGSSAHPHHD